MKKTLASFGIKLFVLVACMAFGYYVLGPRLEFSTDGKPRLNLTKTSDPKNGSTETTNTGARPKVDVYEKLPSATTTTSGVYAGSREIGSANAPIRQPRKTDSRTQAKPEKEEEIIIDDAIIDNETSIETPVIEIEPDPEPEPKPEPEPVKSEPKKQEPKEPTEPAKSPSEPPKEPAQPPASSSALYRVQVGIFSNREGANSAAQSLRASGFDATIVPFQRDGKTMYRVQSLVTRDKQKADQTSQALQSKGFTAFVAKVD